MMTFLSDWVSVWWYWAGHTYQPTEVLLCEWQINSFYASSHRGKGVVFYCSKLILSGLIQPGFNFSLCLPTTLDCRCPCCTPDVYNISEVFFTCYSRIQYDRQTKNIFFFHQMQMWVLNNCQELDWNLSLYISESDHFHIASST